MSNTNNTMQTQTSNTLHNAILEAGGKDRPPMLALDKAVLVTEGSFVKTIERYMNNYKNVSQDIRDHLNAEAKAKAVQIILTGINNDIYSTVDVCPNACEMWKSIKRLKQVNAQFLLQLQQEWKRFVIHVKQSQELKAVSYHKPYDILKQHQNEVNEIRAKILACTANPLALVAQQQSVYHPQSHPTYYTQNSSTKSQQAATRNRGKVIVNSPPPICDQEPYMVAEDDEMSKDKEIDKLMALISLSFKKIYKTTNNNLRTSSPPAEQIRIILQGLTEALEAHYMYMAQLQEVTPDAADNSGPIFDTEPLQKLVEIILFIVDSGCSKHMMGNLKLLTNFVEKFLDTVKFRNDQIASILGYGDLVQGTVSIKRVYYVERMNHNLFSVGQFCDADLEVTFWKSTCYIRDLKGNDLLTGSRGTNLYSISLQNTSSPNLICLIAKATSSQAWLWHGCLSHLNFDTINLLLKNDIVTGLLKLKLVKDHLYSSCELGKAKRKYFKTKTTPSSKRRL
nr:integrase, catalytic region, zinc finger, CCHC-type, peptidase aspartic, catalytic [Tanacetum cinerariifolium]